jgi:hypothetical protein
LDFSTSFSAACGTAEAVPFRGIECSLFAVPGSLLFLLRGDVCDWQVDVAEEDFEAPLLFLFVSFLVGP